MNIGVLPWTSLGSRFSREFNSPELECGQDSSGKSATVLSGHTLPRPGGNIPQVVTDKRMSFNRQPSCTIRLVGRNQGGTLLAVLEQTLRARTQSRSSVLFTKFTDTIFHPPYSREGTGTDIRSDSVRR